jgi:hypothetical protein
MLVSETLASHGNAYKTVVSEVYKTLTKDAV